MNTNRPVQLFVHLAFFLMMMWSTVLIFGVLLTYRRLSGQPFGFIDWLCIVLLAFPLLMALFSLVSHNIETQASLLYVRGQWDNLLKMMPKYRETIANALGEPRADLATRTWKARAMANLGQADEALEQLDSMPAYEELSETDRLMARVQVLMDLDEYEQARNSAQELLETDPERVEAWAAICELDALYFDDPESARMALDDALSLNSWNNLKPTQDYLKGITNSVEGEYALAIEQLERFRKWAQSFAMQMPTAWSLWAAAACVMARSYRALGEHDKAQRLIDETSASLERLSLHGVLGELEKYLRYESQRDDLTISDQDPGLVSS